MDRLPVEVEGGAAGIDSSHIEFGPCRPGVRFRSGSRPYSTPANREYERASWADAPR